MNSRTLLPRLLDLVSRRDSETPDRELLLRFSSRHDESAFAEVARRHAPMVLRVCRHVLHNSHDAEDVAQAALLLLARKAASIGWHDSVAGWLFQTAYRLALNARIAAGRRSRHEARAKPAAPADPVAELTVRELQAALDEEISRLPPKYRAPIILCCLEGRSRDEAAHCLGWPLAAVKDRLERGRERLRARLARRGVLLATALTSAWLLEGEALAGLSPHAIARDALLLATGQATLAGLLPPHVAELAGTMLVSRVTILLAGLALALGTAAAVTRPHDERPPSGPKAQAKTVEAKAPAPEAALAQPKGMRLIGHTGAVRAVAFAPDGKTVATSGADKTIRIWQVATGAQKHKMARAWDATGRKSDNLEHTAVALGLAYAPDGKTLATHSTGKYGWLVLWDAVNGQEKWSSSATRHRLREEGGAVACSPDGKVTVAGFGGGFTIVYENQPSGTEIAGIDGQAGRASIAISPDSKLLAVAGGGSIQLAELPTRRRRRVSPRQIGQPGKTAVRAMAFLGADRVVAADGGKGLRVLDTATGQEERAFISPDAVLALAAGAGGRRLATAGEGGIVVLWDALGKQERRFSARDPVTALAFSPDGKRLATAGPGGVTLWDLTRHEKPLPRDFALTRKELDRLWADLASGDGARVYPAFRLLGADPGRATPFLRERLESRPADPDLEKLPRLIADLDAGDFKTRESATRRLEKAGKAARAAILAALEAKPSLELKTRLERLLKRLRRAAPTAEQQRDVRAVRVLEQSGTPQARKVLEALSRKSPHWWIVGESKAALRRLSGRDKKP
jgi:RNA polymerase sigma factor (sigma-70 family)